MAGLSSSPQSSSRREAVLCHPPETHSDLSLEMLLRRLESHRGEMAVEQGQRVIGLKLDFKDPEAVAPSLRTLQEFGFDPRATPLWLNADVFQGPGMEGRFLVTLTFTGERGW